MSHVLSSDDRGVEWISLTGFISFATSTPNNLGLVRNELQLVDLPTGQYLPRDLYDRLAGLLGRDKREFFLFLLVLLLS